MVSRLGLELSPDYSGMSTATTDSLVSRGCSRSTSSMYPGGTPASPSLPSSLGGLRPQLSRDGLPEWSGLCPSPYKL